MPREPFGKRARKCIRERKVEQTSKSMEEPKANLMDNVEGNPPGT